MSAQKRLSALVVLVSLFASYGGAQELSDEAKADIDKRMNTQRKWDARSNTPGGELIAKEKGGTNQVFVYDFYAKGLPENLNYGLYSLATMAAGPEGLQKQGGDLTIGPKGELMDGPGDPRSLFILDPAPGEAFRQVLLSNDGKYRALLSLIPKPIEGKDRQCIINVVRLMPKFELAFIQATGFPPNAEIDFQSDSLGEVHNGKLKTNADGYTDTGILPFVKGKSKGKTEIRMTSSQCSPKVTFHWGTTTE